MNQASGLGYYTGDILYFTRVLMFISFLSVGYALSRPRPADEKNTRLLLSDATKLGSQGQDWAVLSPWQRKVSEKAVARYAGSQEKKWQRWNEAMFEPEGKKERQGKNSSERSD